MAFVAEERILNCIPARPAAIFDEAPECLLVDSSQPRRLEHALNPVERLAALSFQISVNQKCAPIASSSAETTRNRVVQKTCMIKRTRTTSKRQATAAILSLGPPSLRNCANLGVDRALPGEPLDDGVGDRRQEPDAKYELSQARPSAENRQQHSRATREDEAKEGPPLQPGRRRGRECLN